MLFVVTIILVLYFLKKGSSLRKNFFLLSAIETVFFFSSRDPFLEIPLWFYCMLISIALAMFLGFSIEKKLLLEFMLIIAILLVPIIKVGFGMNNELVLLLNESNSDVLDITSELRKPVLNFTVIKHFLFTVVYLLFVLCNYDLIRQMEIRQKLVQLIEKGFSILLPCIIVEFLIVNALGGFNDRQLMAFVFSIEQMNQKVLWESFIPNLKCVAFCFSERSNIFIITFLYIILYEKEKLKTKDIKLIIMSYFAVLATGSSTALGIAMLFTVLFIIKEFIHGNYMNKNIIIIYSFIFIVCIIFCFIYKETLFVKISGYFSSDSGWGSAYFRRNANSYGVKAFLNHPLFGVCIGTVYAHSLMIQTLANIGILGVISTYYFHIRVLKIKCTMEYKIILLLLVLICCFAFMLQHFTSLMFLTALICASTKTDTASKGVAL